MDVYVATSMRKKWEFVDISDFVNELFLSERLRDLRVRHFDPTQSDCAYRIDKGLVEALMLKRALCTVYMVQESDTLGKDSELASTLAQGKPVIAYVPTIDPEKHAAKLEGYPLEFFKIRLQSLQAEGLFDAPDLHAQLEAIDKTYAETISEFLAELTEFADKQPFTLWESKDEEFKRTYKRFSLVCKLLAIAEKKNFDKRADVLRETHPLSLQVHLESGVANGVLIVRSVPECEEVLYKLLTNSLSFTIESDEKQGCTVLRENISKSPFRAVTEYEKLSNSFWNFYLSVDQQWIEEGEGTSDAKERGGNEKRI